MVGKDTEVLDEETITFKKTKAKGVVRLMKLKGQNDSIVFRIGGTVLEKPIEQGNAKQEDGLPSAS